MGKSFDFPEENKMQIQYDDKLQEYVLTDGKITGYGETPEEAVEDYEIKLSESIDAKQEYYM